MHTSSTCAKKNQSLITVDKLWLDDRRSGEGFYRNVNRLKFSHFNAKMAVCVSSLCCCHGDSKATLMSAPLTLSKPCWDPLCALPLMDFWWWHNHWGCFLDLLAERDECVCVCVCVCVCACVCVWVSGRCLGVKKGLKGRKGRWKQGHWVDGLNRFQRMWKTVGLMSKHSSSVRWENTSKLHVCECVCVCVCVCVCRDYFPMVLQSSSLWRSPWISTLSNDE